MNQRPLIYVHRITNLSDARYCAGMGVDMLGFVVDPSDPDYVTPKLYQDMIGWISGPKRVIEWRSSAPPDWDQILEAYKPDLIHIPLTTLSSAPAHPLMIEVDASGLYAVQVDARISHVIVNDGLKIRSIPQSISVPVLLSVPGDVNTSDLLPGTGLALQGTSEVAPGLKDYDHLSTILDGFES